MSQKPERPSLPTHLGIIPDGNRRWAQANGQTSLQGHQRGFEITKDIFETAFERGIKYLTIYAFSTENWNRTKEEIGYLMKIYERWLAHDLRELEERGIKFRWLGQEDGLPGSLVKILREAEERTAENTKGTLGICLNYGGLQELADAAGEVAGGGEAATPDGLMQHLYAPDIPPLDLVIRTSGEQRTSGFMLARAAYAELYFVEKHWPDFTSDDLDAALGDYAHRQRRFGA